MGFCKLIRSELLSSCSSLPATSAHRSLPLGVCLALLKGALVIGEGPSGCYPAWRLVGMGRRVRDLAFPFYLWHSLGSWGSVSIY